MSVSEKQLEANRRNALRSTGPRSEAGKAIVARNATSHGLCGRHAVIEGESQDEFDLLYEEMIADLKPVGMLECCLADKIISSIWRQHRAVRIENEVMGTLRDPMEENAGNKNQLPFKFVINKHYAGLPEGYEEVKASPEMVNEKCGMENEDSDLGPRQIDKSSSEQAAMSNGQAAESSGQIAKSDAVKKLSMGRAVRNDIEGSNILQKFQRYASEIDRGLYKAIKEFDRLQEKRAKHSIIDVEPSAEG